MDWSKILPVLMTVIFTGLVNFIFFYFFQKKHQDQLEVLKVVFSGIYKRRVDIYDTLLKEVYDLKAKVEIYAGRGDTENYKFSAEIKKSFNDFKRFNSLNKSYLSSDMLQNLDEYKSRLEEIFEAAASFNDNEENIAITPEKTLKQRVEAKNNALKKLTQTTILEDIEKKIVNEMRTHLGTIETEHLLPKRKNKRA